LFVDARVSSFDKKMQCSPTTVEAGATAVIPAGAKCPKAPHGVPDTL
jgi:hypothetical protein